MKAKFILFILTVCAGTAFAAESSLTTTDGRTYDHISSLRADPDGLYIEYTTPRGGLGSAKVKFTRLSADQQKQYGYNADAAQKYEEGAARAVQSYLVFVKKQDEARQKAQSERAALELQEETLAAQRQVAAAKAAEAARAAKAAEAAARAAQNSGAAMPYYTPDDDYGYGLGIVAPASPRAFTGESYQGNFPYGTLFTPLGFQPAKPQSTPATPGGQIQSANIPASHESEMHRF